MPQDPDGPAIDRPHYVVVTPARNEQDNIGNTIASMAAQSILPSLWVIVNDGSSDGTASLIISAAERYPWIRAMHRSDRGFRKQGGGVVETFYDGFESLNEINWDFLVKFDADLSFSPDYFERCLDEFALDKRLGIGGGLICHHVANSLVSETPNDPAFHVRGATKIYRRSCWDAIGGLVRAPGWDTIDELKANMLGWTTRTFPEIKLTHHRPTGAADGSWNDWVKNGLANYITGYDPIFMICKCIRRTIRKPHMNGFGLWMGYMKGFLKRIPRVDDEQLIDYLRRQQRRALTFRSSFWR